MRLAILDGIVARLVTQHEEGQLIDHLNRVIAHGGPNSYSDYSSRLRVRSHNRIQPTYRVIDPAVCATSGKMGRPGIEPGTYGL